MERTLETLHCMQIGVDGVNGDVILREKVGCKGKHMVYIKLNVKLFIAF
jgi:hypothetical protein